MSHPVDQEYSTVLNAFECQADFILQEMQFNILQLFHEGRKKALLIIYKLYFTEVMCNIRIERERDDNRKQQRI